MTTVTMQTGKWVPELTFGARLALVRHRMGWNTKEAAEACGLPKQSWRGWEVDGHLPRRHVEIAKQISGVTGVDYLWLVHGPDRGGDGGGGFKGRLNPLAERVITPRPVVRSSPVQPPAPPGRPTRRRAKPLRSPNRVERLDA